MKTRFLSAALIAAALVLSTLPADARPEWYTNGVIVADPLHTQTTPFLISRERLTGPCGNTVPFDAFYIGPIGGELTNGLTTDQTGSQWCFNSPAASIIIGDNHVGLPGTDAWMAFSSATGTGGLIVVGVGDTGAAPLPTHGWILSQQDDSTAHYLLACADTAPFACAAGTTMTHFAVAVTCSASSGFPCVFPWTCNVSAGGSTCAATHAVPAGATCNPILTSASIVGSTGILLDAPLSGTTQTVNARALAAIGGGTTVTGNAQCE